ncbi:MAG TPA: acyl-CoA dehydrogenase family protein, partial [Acidimicrobiales bacterium]|nr:acyl-CoA dehydrogenase family protein [Acidimicrobiales bacterium]
MSIAITEDHRTLARTASDFLLKNGARGAARDLLEARTEQLPAFWGDVGELGWLGLHISEEHGGSGFGLPELVIVVEELGRAVAPGPFVPTVTASAVIAAAAPPEIRARLLPGLAEGTSVGAVALAGSVEVRRGAAYGSAGAVLSGALADVLLVPVGDDVVIVDRSNGGVTVEVPTNLDPTRRSARVTLDGAPVEVI